MLVFTRYQPVNKCIQIDDIFHMFISIHRCIYLLIKIILRVCVYTLIAYHGSTHVKTCGNMFNWQLALLGKCPSQLGFIRCCAAHLFRRCWKCAALAARCWACSRLGPRTAFGDRGTVHCTIDRPGPEKSWDHIPELLD